MSRLIYKLASAQSTTNYNTKYHEVTSCPQMWPILDSMHLLYNTPPSSTHYHITRHHTSSTSHLRQRSWSSDSDTLLSLSDEAVVALLVGASGSETSADDSWPRAALEEKDGGDDTEREAEGRADEEGGETAVPLQKQNIISAIVHNNPSNAVTLAIHSPPNTIGVSCNAREQYKLHGLWVRRAGQGRTFSLSRASLTGLLGRAAIGAEEEDILRALDQRGFT